MKYRKKPIVIEAKQWFRHGDIKDVVPFKDNRFASGNNGRCGLDNIHKDEHGWIKTLEGGYIVCPGDWIIVGVQGEKYPCKPSIFERTYEKVLE